MEAQHPAPPSVSPGLGTSPLAATEPWFLCLWRITGWMGENMDEMTSVKAFSQRSANGTFPAERAALRVTCGRAQHAAVGPAGSAGHRPGSTSKRVDAKIKNVCRCQRPRTHMPSQGSWHLQPHLASSHLDFLRSVCPLASIIT